MNGPQASDDIPFDVRRFDPSAPTLFDLIDAGFELVRLKADVYDDAGEPLELDDWSPEPPIGPAYGPGWHLLGKFEETWEEYEMDGFERGEFLADMSEFASYWIAETPSSQACVPRLSVHDVGEGELADYALRCAASYVGKPMR